MNSLSRATLAHRGGGGTLRQSIHHRPSPQQRQTLLRGKKIPLSIHWKIKTATVTHTLSDTMFQVTGKDSNIDNETTLTITTTTDNVNTSKNKGGKKTNVNNSNSNILSITTTSKTLTATPITTSIASITMSITSAKKRQKAIRQ